MFRRRLSQCVSALPEPLMYSAGITEIRADWEEIYVLYLVLLLNGPLEDEHYNVIGRVKSNVS